jgi:hypothetical protein
MVIGVEAVAAGGAWSGTCHTIQYVAGIPRLLRAACVCAAECTADCWAGSMQTLQLSHHAVEPGLAGVWWCCQQRTYPSQATFASCALYTCVVVCLFVLHKQFSVSVGPPLAALGVHQMQARLGSLMAH